MGTKRLAWMTLVAAGAALPALAQGGPPGFAGDPPARVGRVARIVGTVSFHLAGADRWEPATLNLPVATGGAFWTEPGAQAELGVAEERLVLDAVTELDVTQLDMRTLAVTLPQGRMYWHEARLPAGEVDVVQTPRGAVTLSAVGRYEVTAGDTAAPTVVTVVEGGVDIAGPGLAVHVGPHQTATLTGDGTTEPVRATVEASGPPDAFLAAMLAAERPVRRPGVAVPGYVTAMTGGEALEEYGDWADVPRYGAVWYPPVQAGFVPYRAGRWAWVRPWGWTWVDDAPWGFAPSHYGRWVQVDERWGWVPGPVGVTSYVPTYLPAVVGFLGGAALGRPGSVGWVPLGPGDPYRPQFRASATYLQQVNIGTVNIGTGPAGRRAPPLNAAGATVVPVGAMVGSQVLTGLARPVQGPPPMVRAVPGVAPGAATLGAPIAGRAGAPGPAIRPVMAGPRAPGPLPGLRAPGQGLPRLDGAGPGGPRPDGAPGVPGLTAPRLRAPGADGPGRGAPGPDLAGRGAPGPDLAGRGAPGPELPGGLAHRPEVAGRGAPGPVLLGRDAARPEVDGRGAPGPAVPGRAAPGLPALRAPGAEGGERPHGGAPGPALPERPGAIGGLPAVVTPPASDRAEERPGGIALPRAGAASPGGARDAVAPRPEAAPVARDARPAPLPQVQGPPPQRQPAPPQPRQEAPQARREVPQPREEAPQPRREVPQPRQEVPQPRREMPQPRQEAPQPRPAPQPPRQEAPPPRREAPQPRPEAPQQRPAPQQPRPEAPQQRGGPPPGNHGGPGHEGHPPP